MKLKKKAKIIIVIVVLLIIGCVVWHFGFRPKSKVSEAQVVSEIEKYGYQLHDNKSKEYQALFKELEKVLKEDVVDEKKYAELISKMFILDFYTLDNKVAKTDVGGADFLHPDELDDFLEKAMDTVYKYVQSNIYNERKQELPYVKKVTVEDISNTSFDYLDTTDENAYKVKVNWEYAKDLGYENEATITLVHDDIKLVIVEMD